jgi:hypothetical protein
MVKRVRQRVQSVKKLVDCQDEVGGRPKLRTQLGMNLSLSSQVIMNLNNSRTEASMKTLGL